MSIGERYLTAAELTRRVGELGAEIARDFESRDLLLVVPLKGSVVFAADLSRCIRIPHALDFVELEPYGRGERGIRLLKDLDTRVAGRDVLVVEDVVDTGLTLHYLCRTLALRRPASLTVVTLLDRPYRRLVDDLPVRYVGFTVPDELFVGYGFDLEQRYRNLPDLHVFVPGTHAGMRRRVPLWASPEVPAPELPHR
jgi:hypoxanthine phosphoribosyltransferase